MNPQYRIRRRRKHRPGDAASTPTGPYRWRLEQRVPATGLVSIFRDWEWKTIRYRTTHAGAIVAMDAHVRRPTPRTGIHDYGITATWDNRAHARP